MPSVTLRWRIVATIELTLYAIFVFLTVILTLQNFVAVLAMSLTFGLSLFACWLVVSRTGRRRLSGWALLVASILLLIVELLRFLAKGNNLGIIIFSFVILAAYVLILAVFRPKYWRFMRTTQSAHAYRSRHPILIVNPKSGNGRAVRQGIVEKARALGVEVFVLQEGDDMTAVARTAVQKGADLLGISGGDGSIGAIAVVALEYDVPMVVLPGGTRCHFARDLGMDPARIVDALDSFQGIERRVDVGDINGRIFLNNASFGLYADIINYPGYRQNKMQASRTVLTELLEKKRALYSLSFQASGGEKFDKAAQLLVGVNRYQTMNMFELGYRNVMDEGVLQVTAITDIDDRLVGKLLRSMSISRFIKKSDSNHIYQWETKTFVVSSRTKTLIVGVDGERELYTTPVRISIKPGALRVIVPAEGMRPRQYKAFDRKVVNRLWRMAVGKP